jgi:formamidopyrimidine-DNA glycosylase
MLSRMPELPDVEVYRRHLEAHALGRVVARVELRDGLRMLEGVSAAQLRRALEGRPLDATRRLGKYLFAHVADDGWLLFHFGMTGRLRYGSDEEDAAHNVLLLHFADGGALAYNSRRRLGRFGVVDDPQAYAAAKRLGPDALGLDEAGFLRRLEGRSGAVKGVLMNQAVVAGIGNVYSDELLYQAGIHPQTPLDRIDDAGRRALYRALGAVLTTAIDRGAAPERLPDDWLTPRRGRRNARCPACDAPLRRISVGGRSGYFCPCRQGTSA